MIAIITFSLSQPCYLRNCFFFFNDTATTEIYTLSLHDALPIYLNVNEGPLLSDAQQALGRLRALGRSEEHTSELQSHLNLVCRLLLEKKKKAVRSVILAALSMRSYTVLM